MHSQAIICWGFVTLFSIFQSYYFLGLFDGFGERWRSRSCQAGFMLQSTDVLQSERGEADETRRSLCHRENAGSSSVCLCDSAKKRARTWSETVWLCESLHVCVDVSCVGERKLMKWPVKRIKGNPFTLLLKQLCSEMLCCHSCLLCQIHDCALRCCRMFFLVGLQLSADDFFRNFPIPEWSILCSLLADGYYSVTACIKISVVPQLDHMFE